MCESVRRKLGHTIRTLYRGPLVHDNSISFRCLNNHELLNALIKSNSPFHFWLQQEFQFFTAVSLINGTKLKNLPMYIMKPKLLISVDDLVLVYCNLSPILYSGPKGAFFQKSRFFVQISQSPKKIFQKIILSLKFEIPAHISKQLIQISSSG